MKNTLSEMKSISEDINRVDKEEAWTTDIEDGEAKDTQSKWEDKKAETIQENRTEIQE